MEAVGIGCFPESACLVVDFIVYAVVVAAEDYLVVFFSPAGDYFAVAVGVEWYFGGVFGFVDEFAGGEHGAPCAGEAYGGY